MKIIKCKKSKDHWKAKYEVINVDNEIMGEIYKFEQQKAYFEPRYGNKWIYFSDGLYEIYKIIKKLDEEGK